MQLSGIDETLPGAGIVPGSDHDGMRLGRLPLGRKTGYASGQLIEMVVGSMLNVFILFYVTAVCGLPDGLAGLALGAGLVVDAVMDPLIGSVSDGWRSRFGRRVPFMFVSLVPLLLAFNLIFALPSWLDWDAFVQIRRRWKGPLLLKGVLCVEDAVRAVAAGADGIVVSNHGARNLDCSPASIDMLTPIADAVGDRCVVLLDSGVRRGADVARALALGRVRC